MPIYMEISRLHRCVTVVARGKINPDEIQGAAQQLFDARVPQFAKIVDVSMATAEVDPQQVERIAALLRGGPQDKRGPVAFLIDARRGEFARAFKATQDPEQPIMLFTSLHQARDWLKRLNEEEREAGMPQRAAPPPADSTPWTDRQRQAVLFRGDRRRELPVAVE